MAKYPTKRNKPVEPKLIKHDFHSIRPIIALGRTVYNSGEKRAANKANQKENVRFNKEDKAYQSSLKKMGATVNGGGRGNVPKAVQFNPEVHYTPKAGASNPPTQKGTPKSSKILNRSIEV